MSSDRSSKIRSIAIFFSLLLHAVAMGVLAWWTVGGFETPTPTPSMPIRLAQVEQKAGQSPVVDGGELKSKIEKGVASVASMPAEQKERILNDNALWLERSSNAKHIEEIGAVIRKSLNAPHRAYAPAETPPAGDYNYGSSLLYSQEEKEFEDGIARKVNTWVDKDGRTLITTFRKGTDREGKPVTFTGVYGFDGKLFEQPSPDDGSLDTFNSLQQKVIGTPLMKKLYNEAILPAIEAYRQSTAKTKPHPALPGN